MNKAELIEKICDIEERNFFYDIEIDDIKIWPLFRSYILEKIVLSFEKTSVHPDLKVNYLNFKTGLSLLKCSIFNFGYKKYKKVDYLFYSCFRKRIDSDGYYSPLISPIIKQLNQHNYLVIERPMPNIGHLGFGHPINLIYSDRVELLRFFGLFYYKKSKKTDKWYEKISQIKKTLEIELGFDIDIPELRSRVIHTLSTFYIVGRKIFKILKYINPKTVVLKPHYELNSMVLTYYCHKQGINVVELQHGYIGPIHESYNYAFENDSCKIYFPNKILVFGEFWKDSIHYPDKENKVIATGFPEFEMNMSNLGIDISSKKILFISEATGKHDLTKLCIDLANNPLFKEYSILFKMHPNECNSWENVYPELIDVKNIEVIDNMDNSVYYYFSKSLMVVGTESTVLFEALGFGLITCILSNPSREKLFPLDETNNKLRFIKDSEDIVQILNKNDNICSYSNETRNEYFFKSNSIENIIQELN